MPHTIPGMILASVVEPPFLQFVIRTEAFRNLSHLFDVRNPRTRKLAYSFNASNETRSMQSSPGMLNSLMAIYTIVLHYNLCRFQILNVSILTPLLDPVTHDARSIAHIRGIELLRMNQRKP
jgi:hypothetical protein